MMTLLTVIESLRYGRSEKPNVQYPDWLESRFTEDPKEVERREYQDGVAAEMAARRRARVAWLRSQSEPSVVPSKAAAVGRLLPCLHACEVCQLTRAWHCMQTRST